MSKVKVITGLDIGTHSIKALAAVKNPESEDLEVLGKVEIPSSGGVRRGVVVNIDKASKDISQCLTQLQQDINHKIENVYVNISGSHIFCTPSHGTVVVSRADQKISREDVERVVQAARVFSLPFNKEILEIFPREFIVDGQGKIKDPLDMQGLRLEAQVLALCGFAPFLKNLTAAVLNSGFQISDVTLSSLASSMTVLTPQQKELGVCLLDIGAGTTDMAVYEEGDLIHAAVFPIGSERITNDLAVGFKTDVDIAEQIKKQFGTCIRKGGSKKEKIDLSESDNPEVLTFSHKQLVSIIEARVSQIFDLAQKELKNLSLEGPLPAGIVLTGGAVKLPRIVELAKKEMKLPVRIGIPQWQNLEKDPSLSTVCGLVLASVGLEEERWSSEVQKERITSKFKKMFKIFLP